MQHDLNSYDEEAIEAANSKSNKSRKIRPSISPETSFSNPCKPSYMYLPLLKSVKVFSLRSKYHTNSKKCTERNRYQSNIEIYTRYLFNNTYGNC